MPHVPRNVQAPNTAADFWTQWRSVNPRMALFVLITPQSFWTGINPIGITSNTRDMTLPGHPGVTFKSTPGVTPSVIEQVLNEPTNIDLSGIYQTGIFEWADVIAGKWSFSEIEIFSASWQNVDLGELLHFRGKVGDFHDFQTYFTAEARGLISLLSNEVAPVTQKFCRVKEFRDAECGHTATTVTIHSVAYNVVQTGVDGNPGSSIESIIFDTSTFAGNDPTAPNIAAYAALFANGKITAVDGPNAGVSREISGANEATGGHPFMRVFLKRPFPFEITTTTEFNLVMGCDRTVEKCVQFGNIVNRRAEDWIPTIEAANRVPPSN